MTHRDHLRLCVGGGDGGGLANGGAVAEAGRNGVAGDAVHSRHTHRHSHHHHIHYGAVHSGVTGECDAISCVLRFRMLLQWLPEFSFL